MAASSIFPDSWLTTTPEHQHSLTTTTTTTTSTIPSPRQKNNITSVPPRKKPTKRKSRASKKTQTTYITADPANFRQMVQQVTGVRFNGMVHDDNDGLFRPEPMRIHGSGGAVSCLPTLDTSPLLFQHVGSGVIGEFDGFPTLESSFSRVVESGFVTF